MAVTLEIDWYEYGLYRIMDVPQKQYNNALAFMLEHFRSYQLYKILNIQEEPGIEQNFKDLVKHILENDCSIMVVHKETNAVHGVALLQWMTRKWHSWTSLQLLIESERFKELYSMVNYCLEQWKSKNASSNDTAMDTMHLFSYHLTEELVQDEEFLEHFFNSICEVARHMRMPRVTYICMSGIDREFMNKAGFEEVARIIYSLFVHKGRRPFDHLRDMNEMYGGLYQKLVAPLTPYHEMVIRHHVDKDPKDDKKK